MAIVAIVAVCGRVSLRLSQSTRAVRGTYKFICGVALLLGLCSQRWSAVSPGNKNSVKSYGSHMPDSDLWKSHTIGIYIYIYIYLYISMSSVVQYIA